MADEISVWQARRLIAEIGSSELVLAWAAHDHAVVAREVGSVWAWDGGSSPNGFWLPDNRLVAFAEFLLRELPAAAIAGYDAPVSFADQAIMRRASAAERQYWDSRVQKEGR